MHRMIWLIGFCIGCQAEKSALTDDSGVVEEPSYDEETASGCHSQVADWEYAWQQLEFITLDEVNARRALGANCGEFGDFAPADPLEMEPHIHCSARYHSFWMGFHDTISHDSPGGDMGGDPFARMQAAGFPGFATGENVAAGYQTPQEVVAGWMTSDGHCSLIMSPDHNKVGVGFYLQEASTWGYFWTLNFGLLVEAP